MPTAAGADPPKVTQCHRPLERFQRRQGRNWVIFEIYDLSYRWKKRLSYRNMLLYSLNPIHIPIMSITVLSVLELILLPLLVGKPTGRMPMGDMTHRSS